MVKMLELNRIFHWKEKCNAKHCNELFSFRVELRVKNRASRNDKFDQMFSEPLESVIEITLQVFHGMLNLDGIFTERALVLKGNIVRNV